MWRALDIARLTGLLIYQSPKFHGVQQRGHVLEVGLNGSPDEVATLGVRRYLYPNGGEGDERRVRVVVQDLGYEYVPQASGLHAPLV